MSQNMWMRTLKLSGNRRQPFHTLKRAFSKDNGKTKPGNSQKVPTSADVVIIGGGIIGCSTLYHLTKLGVTNVVLLERNKLTSGTTWHTAGLIWRLRPNDTDIQILNHTRHLLKNVLEKETGIHPGWTNNGGLFIANSKERLDEYKRLMTIGKVFGIESHVLSPSDTKKLYPLLNVEDLYGTLHSPGDGTVDPAEFCAALTKAATKAGAKVLENCPVTGVHVEENDFGVKHVKSVVTANGSIQTDCLINCTGVWAPSIGQMAGVRVPLIAMKHAYVVTNRIEGIQNMPNVRDHDLSLYLRLQGDSLCVGGYEPNPIFWEKVQQDFAFSLFELDWDVFGSHIQNGYHRCPILESTGIRSTVCGPESFTPDHKPLLGEDLEVRGFYHGCGFNSLGMNAGGGSGRELAKWVVFGRPELDMFAYDIRRFSRKISDNQKWIKERSHEAYVKNYSVVYPHDEPLASRNMRKDPFHEHLLKQGCVFQEREGWERPGWYSPEGPSALLDYDFYGSYGNVIHKDYAYAERLKMDYTFDFPNQHKTIEKECLGCRQDVALFNMSYFGKFILSGPDAQQAADWIFSNDMAKPFGSTVYTCMLNKRGGVEADLTVSPIQSGEAEWETDFKGRGFYVAAGGASAQQSWSHIQTALQDKHFNAHLTDISEEVGLLSIQGPKSRALLQEICDVDLSNENFPFSSHRVLNIAGHKVRALRLSFVGELGWELHIPKASCVPVYEALISCGKKHGLVHAGYRAIDSLSIEKGYRHWHGDIRMDDTPMEGGLAFSCKLKVSTPFLGREALEEHKKRGAPRKRIACFTIDEHVPLVGLEAIWRNGTAVGFLRRADFGFALGKSMGYGYVTDPEKGAVSLDYLKSGEYVLESRGTKYPAILHTKSPFDANNKRVKGIYDEPLPIHCN